MAESWDIDLPAQSEGDAADLIINANGFAVTVESRPHDKRPNGEATIVKFENGISVLVRLSRTKEDTVVVETYGETQKQTANLAADFPSGYSDPTLGQARSHYEFTVRA